MTIDGPCACPDDPCTMLTRVMCVSPVSKNLEGEAKPPQGNPRECSDPSCTTLTTLQTLELRAVTNQPCDGHEGVLLDGDIVVTDFVTVLHGDGGGRGFHSGKLR